MIKCFVLIVVLAINSGLNDADVVDVSSMTNVIESVLRDLEHADLKVGRHLGDINKATWKKTLKRIVPDLQESAKGLKQITKALSVFIDKLLNEGKKHNSNDYYVPHSILMENKRAVDEMNKAFNNIIEAKLKFTIKESKESLESQSGEINIPGSLAQTVISILNYVTLQFKALKSATTKFGNALIGLADALDKSKSQYGNELFEGCSDAARKSAEIFGLMERDFSDLIQQYFDLAVTDSNGNITLPAQGLLVSTNSAAKRLSNNMDRIASFMQLLLNKISESRSY